MKLNVIMLSLLHLIVCEKVIVDMNGGTTSAIAMFETLTATLPNGAPEKLLYPVRWSAMGLWRRDNEIEVPTNFMQKVIVRSPENEEAFTAETPFLVTNDNNNFRHIVEFSGFPVSVSGVVNIEIYLKQENEGEWIKHFSYPVSVIRNMEDMPNANQANAKNINDIENQNNSN